jgi:hypothetical protein
MATPPLRRRAGKIDIENRARQIKEELKKREESMAKEKVTPEEHEERIKMLKSIGLVK